MSEPVPDCEPPLLAQVSSIRMMPLSVLVGLGERERERERERECVRRAQEARLQSLAMQLAESDCTLRVTNTHLCSADSARAKEK